MAAAYRPAARPISVMRFVSTTFGLIGTAPYGSQRRARVLLTTDAGKSFRDVSPPLPAGWVVDDIWPLSRTGWWVATDSIARGPHGRLYRTFDGGAHWTVTHAPGRGIHAGSFINIQALSMDAGYLFTADPAGPVGVLYRTADAVHWHQVGNRTRYEAPVEFSSPSQAWQAGGLFPTLLRRSDDGGRHWHNVDPGATGHRHRLTRTFGLPTVVGSSVAVPVTVRRGNDLLFGLARSSDGGSRWRDTSRVTVPDTVGAKSCGGERAISQALPSVTVRWALAEPRGHPTAYLTRDDGQHWVRRPLPLPAEPKRAICGLPQIVAIDAHHAWVLLAGRLYVTADAGSSWRRYHLR